MKKLFSAALVSLPLLAAAGTGMAIAATGNPQGMEMVPAASHSLIHHVDYVLPNGVWVHVPTCEQVFVGYNVFGIPMFQTVCQ